MRVIQYLSISGLIAMTAAGAAFAGDLPSKPSRPAAQPFVTPYNWTGFYAGLNAGAIFTPKNLDFFWSKRRKL